MEKLTKDLSNIIIDEVKEINEKVRGLNFLELLKTKLIENLLKIIKDQKFPLEKIINYEQEIEESGRTIKVLINYYIKTTSITKKIIERDTLILFFNDNSNLDIYKDEKNYISLVLFKNTGIALPKDTIINAKFNKNLLLIEIINKDIDSILTK